MNVQCGICKDAIDVLSKAGDGGSVASALPCGHVFHSPCINQWLNQSGSAKQGSCPHCRSCVLKKQILKLYLDLVPLENYEEDPVVIKGVNECLKRDIEDLRDRLGHKTQTTDKLIKVNTGLRERLVELEHKLANAETNERILKMTHAKLNSKTKELENALDENNKLKNKLMSLKASNTILNGTLADAQDAMIVLEKEDMAALVYTYKKDSEKLLKKHGDLLNDLARSQEETRKLKKEVQRGREENSILSRIIDVYKPKKIGPKDRTEGTSEHTSPSISQPGGSGAVNLQSQDSSPVTFIDLTSPSGNPSVSRLISEPKTRTPVVVTPDRNRLIRGKFKIPLTSVSQRVSHSQQDNSPFPSSYDGLGGHSRVEEFPSARLPKVPRIVTSRMVTSTPKRPKH